MSGTPEIDDKLRIYRKKNEEMQVLYQQKTQIMGQFNENTLVKGELDMLVEGETVYKLVGPVLMQVEVMEAKGHVGTRLELIEGEVKKVESAISAKKAEIDAWGDDIARLQQKMQADAAASARAIVDSK